VDDIPLINEAKLVLTCVIRQSPALARLRLGRGFVYKLHGIILRAVMFPSGSGSRTGYTCRRMRLDDAPRRKRRTPKEDLCEEHLTNEVHQITHGHPPLAHEELKIDLLTENDREELQQLFLVEDLSRHRSTE
jgi:hypothetical protein